VEPVPRAAGGTGLAAGPPASGLRLQAVPASCRKAGNPGASLSFGRLRKRGRRWFLPLGRRACPGKSWRKSRLSPGRRGARRLPRAARGFSAAQPAPQSTWVVAAATTAAAISQRAAGWARPSGPNPAAMGNSGGNQSMVGGPTLAILSRSRRRRDPAGERDRRRARSPSFT